MYLSRIALNTNRKNTMIAIASPQITHAIVESSFPPSEKSDHNLWRIDRLGDAIYLLVLSCKKPDFSHIVEQYGWPGAEQEWETKDYTFLLENIEVGQLWQFRLRANPTHAVKKTDDLQKQDRTNRGKVYAHVTSQQQEKWLIDRGEKHGFKLMEDSFHVIQRELRKFKRRDGLVTLSVCTFEGVLEVTDVIMFRQTLSYGIGRAKAYGCGLMTIGKVSQ